MSGGSLSCWPGLEGAAPSGGIFAGAHARGGCRHSSGPRWWPVCRGCAGLVRARDQPVVGASHPQESPRGTGCRSCVSLGSVTWYDASRALEGQSGRFLPHPVSLGSSTRGRRRQREGWEAGTRGPLESWVGNPGWPGFPVGLRTLSPFSRRQRTGHRHVPAVHSTRGGGHDPAEADGWGGRQRQPKAVDSVAGGHAQGTWAEAGRGAWGGGGGVLGCSALSVGPRFPEAALPAGEGVPTPAPTRRRPKHASLVPF